MNIGHDGLTGAFNNLETFQTFPDAEPSRYITCKYPTSNISPAKVYSSDIRPVLTCLKQRYSDEILNNTLLSMITALGFNGKFVTRNGFDQLRTSSEILNLSDNTQKYFRSMAHHKSIFFYLKQEEITFRFLFSDLIDKKAHYETVFRKDILIRIDDARFSLVIKRLKNVYSNDIYQKICMKVRTVGRLKRF